MELHTITASSIIKIVKSISSPAATCVRTYSVLTVLLTLILTIGTFIDVWMHYKNHNYACTLNPIFKWTMEIHTMTASSIIIVKSISSPAATCVRTYSVLTVLLTLILTIGTFIDVWMHYKNHNYACTLNPIFKWTMEIHTMTASSIIIVKSISSPAVTCVRTYSVPTVLFTLILTIGTFIDI